MLAEEGFDEISSDKILQEYAETGFANTNSKSVLGSMNDLAKHYQYYIEEAGGVHSYRIPQIIHQLNRMPMGAIGYRFSVEALRKLYEA